ncbi:hypothetical protein [Streptomyces sp. NPDC096311]|uniref:hypothetical protein n=1 Tax=Streptomyces sp. NPDC096311 TaxID=3366083 RepID=UPI00382F2777
MADALLLVFSNPVPGREDEFTDWYEHRHLGDVLAVPGVTAARFYENAQTPPSKAEDASESLPAGHSHLAAYELDRDVDDVLAEFGRRVRSGEMPMSEAMDRETMTMTAWRPRGPRLEKGAEADQGI